MGKSIGMRLMRLIGAFFAAIKISPMIGHFLPNALQDYTVLLSIISFLIVFLAVILIGMLFNYF